MDDTEFLRGIEGEKQQGTDLVGGAEHLVRLKQQVGQPIQPQYPDLELEKKAGMAGSGGFGAVLGEAGSMARPAYDAARQMGTKGNALGTVVNSKSMNAPVMPRFPGHKLAALAKKLKEKDACANCGMPKTACMCSAGDDMGKTAMPTHKDLGSGYKAAKSGIKDYLRSHPTARAALIGGAATGAVNAGIGAASSPGDRVGGAVRGGIGGAAVGAVGGALAHHLHTKLAEMRVKTASQILEQLKRVDAPLLALSGLGAAAGGLGTYLGSRPKKDTGKSKMEEEMAGRVTAHQEKPGGGLLSKMHGADLEHAHGYSQAFRDHPRKAALIGAIAGGMGGYGLGRIGGAIIRRKGA